MASKVILGCLRSGISGFNSRCLSITACRSGTERSWVPEDPVTHTGQFFDENDYRLARFIDKQKEVNKNVALSLIDQVPPKPCKERVVWCDGGGGPTGHPKVYINLDKPGNHSCGYCGLRFFKDGSHH